MSFADRLVLWLHIGFAIFTIGPVALAISSTPRYIRRREVPILRYLSRITVIFTAASLLVLVFGIVLGQLDHDFAHPWLTAAMTLFVVAIVLLVLVIRDQRRAIKALATVQPPAAESGPDDAAPTAADAEPAADAEAEAAGSGGGQHDAGAAALAAHIASVERGRIAALGGVVNLIWLVILVLMVWQP
jgi:cbb3-type cytochrome oxidase subunit 3